MINLFIFKMIAVNATSIVLDPDECGMYWCCALLTKCKYRLDSGIVFRQTNNIDNGGMCSDLAGAGVSL